MTTPASTASLAAALGSAMAVGLLVGLERGWHQRGAPDGARVAGLRTFAFVGLLGGVLALSGAHAFAAGSVGLALLLAVAYWRESQSTGTLSITTAVAAMLTFALGALAASGQPVAAIGGAVVVAMMLDLKSALHRGLQLIEAPELNAVLQLGILSAVVLPLLPDTGLGPYSSLNPFRLWLAVVVVAALSLAGHVAMRVRGSSQGLMWMGALGGLASSTAATLALARRTKAQPELSVAAASATLTACAVMFLRMAVIVLALQPGITRGLAMLLALMAAGSFAAAALLWKRRKPPVEHAAPTEPGGKVFDLPTALGFGALLALVTVAARAATDAFGVGGIVAVAAISGLADVDAAVISGVQLAAQGELLTGALSLAVFVSVVANLCAKTAIAWSVGGPVLGRHVALGYLAVAATGAALLTVTIFA